MIGVCDAPASADGESGRRERPTLPCLVFRALDRADPATYGRMAVGPRDDVAAPRRLGGLTCDRVYFQGERGLCLALAESFPQGYRADLLGSALTPTGSVAVGGIPSRPRVSAAARLRGATTLAIAPSYPDTSDFPTHPPILHTPT